MDIIPHLCVYLYGLRVRERDVCICMTCVCVLQRMAHQEKVQRQQLEEALESRLQRLQTQQSAPPPSDPTPPCSSDSVTDTVSNGSAPLGSLQTVEPPHTAGERRDVSHCQSLHLPVCEYVSYPACFCVSMSVTLPASV